MRCIAIVSGKGGVGKTTTAINLGSSLNAFAKDVIIVDGNLTSPDISLSLGAPVIPVSIHDVLLNKAKPKEAVYYHHSGTKIMPGSLSKSAKPEKLAQVIAELKKMSDMIILDCAAGLGEEASSAIKAADELIVVTQPELPAITSALKTIKFAEKLGKHCSVILTRVRNTKYELPLESIHAMLERPIIATIPEDETVKEALSKRDTLLAVNQESKAAQCYLQLAALLIGRKFNEEKKTKFNLLKFLKIKK